MITLGILGADGSMGRHIISLALNNNEFEIKLAYTIPESPNLDMDVGIMAGVKPLNVKIKSIENLENDLKTTKPDIFVDFTVAKATEKNIPIILKYNIPVIVGTTGLSDGFLKDLERISKDQKIPMVISTNMAIGVNVLFKFAAELAKKLNGWEIEIIEVHHHRKKDAPSGTALTIAENIAKSIDVNLPDVAKYGRTKGPNERKWGKDEIGIHAVRAGDIVGDHIILYAGNGERIELKHQAHSRNCFASGALEAAKFLMKNKDSPKIYNMQDVLNLN